MSGQQVIALLGRPDAPTDAVEEYCRYLGEALLAEHFELIIERVNWNATGWGAVSRSAFRASLNLSRPLVPAWAWSFTTLNPTAEHE